MSPITDTTTTDAVNRSKSFNYCDYRISDYIEMIWRGGRHKIKKQFTICSALPLISFFFFLLVTHRIVAKVRVDKQETNNFHLFTPP